MLVAGRREGKTTQVILWLAGAHKVEGNPGWSRILLTFSKTEADRLRMDYPVFARRIFSLREWTHTAARGLGGDLEIAIDNADMILQDLVGFHRLVYATLTGVPA